MEDKKYTDRAPVYIKIDGTRIRLDKIKYYIATDSILRLYLDDKQTPHMELVPKRLNPESMALRLDKLLNLVEL